MSEPGETGAGQRALARRVAVVYFFAAAAWIVLSDLALLSFDVDLGDVVGRSITKGLLFCAVTAAILYAALARYFKRATGEASQLPSVTGTGRAHRIGPAAVFGAMTVLLVFLAVAMFVIEARREDTQARYSLAALVDLKAQQLEQWLEARRKIALSYGGARALREQLAQLTENGAASRQSLEARLESIRSALQVDAVLLLDANGRLAAGGGAAPFLQVSAVLLPKIISVVESGAPAPQFLHRDGSPGHEAVLIDFIVPLRDLGGGATAGALVLRQRADQELSGLVQHWPTPNTSAEAMLVRRDGDDVVYLSDLRFHKDAALSLRRKMSEASLSAAHALTVGDIKVVDDIDYRGVAVVAAARRVAGTDWALIVKLDRDEVIAPVRRTAAIWLAAILGILLLGGLGIGTLWRERMALVALRDRTNATQRRRAEDRLRASEERLRRYFDQGLVGMAITLPDKSFAEVNDKVCQMLGFSRTELTSMDWASITHPEDLAADVAQFERVAAGEIDGYVLDKRFIRKDGSIVDVTLSVGCLRKPDRSIDCIVALLQDVTERKRTEAELRESEARFRAVLEQSIAGVLVIQDGRIVYSNPRMREIFGYKHGERLATDPLAHIKDLDRPRVVENMRRRLAGEREGSYSLAAVRTDGSEFTLGMHAVAASYAGRPAIIVSAQDITEKARVEEERRQRLERYQAQSEVLSAVSLSEALVEGKVTTLARQITEVACRAAGVERANVWLFNDEETELRCIDLYEATPARHSSGAVLAQAQFRNEFAALKESAYVNADKPLADPRTAGYAESYLKPLGITSMLDAVIHFSDRHLGLLCLEHVNRAHHWEHDEISFACQLADKLAIAIVNRRRRKARAALERANRALRTVSAGNEALVRATDEASLLAQMCRAIVEAGGYAVAAVNYVGADGALVPQASAGATPGEPRVVPRAETSALMPADGKPVLLREFDGDATLDSWRASSRHNDLKSTLVRDDLKSALVLPLQHGDAASAYGVLYIAAAEADAFGADEVELLQELSRDLAYGISALRVRGAQRASAARLRASLEASIQAIAATVEMRDPYTAGHEKRVAELAAAIAREMGLPDFTVEGIHFGSLIHDLGKIQVPAEILSKPTRLMPVEYELIKGHSQAGYDILKGIEFPWPIAQMVLQHHERMDGSGYPQKLRGEQIIPEARVLAVADVVEAMSSHRPYRPGLGIDKALAEIERGRGSVYDPQVVDACLRLFREKKYELPA